MVPCIGGEGGCTIISDNHEVDHILECSPDTNLLAVQNHHVTEKEMLAIFSTCWFCIYREACFHIAQLTSFSLSWKLHGLTGFLVYQSWGKKSVEEQLKSFHD